MRKMTTGLFLFLACFITLSVTNAAVAQEATEITTPCEIYGYCPDALVDPGTGVWVPVPVAEIIDTCGLDPTVLNTASIPEGASFAVVRHGRLCYVTGDNGSDGAVINHIFSVTKTLGAVMTGMVMYEARDIPASNEPMTGPFSEWDQIDKWVDVAGLPESFDIHNDATVAHVLSMEAYNDSLVYGDKSHSYDGNGQREINSLIEAINNVVKQDPEHMGENAVAVKNRLFERLGVEHSSWDVGTLGFSWNASLLDMARLGLVILNGGIYDGERLLDADYAYNMTHPAFEDGSTQYGYLTWLNNPECAPQAIHTSYPHGASSAIDCTFVSCDQEFDVGVWNAIGAQGQFVQGHRGLDMVIVAQNWNTNSGSPLWEAVRPALVAADATFQGNDVAFCEAYGSGAYAPNLQKWEGNR
jgi:CubicO group peptidase (beta-lactamase class C family)